MTLAAAFAIESASLDLAELLSVLPGVPDEAWDRGSPARFGDRVRDSSRWSLELDLPGRAHPGTEGLSAAIIALGDDLARASTALVARGCVAVVSVVQELSDDPWTTGLHFDARAVRWMSLARASLDIDQYV